MSLTSHEMRSLLVLIIITIISAAVGAETGVTAEKWSTSGELADLLHTETVLIENLRNYVEALERKLAPIKNKTKEVRDIYDVALNDTGKFFGNPVNTFKLIKRVTYEWATLRNMAWQDVTGNIVENITNFSEFLTFPTEEDLDESVGNLLKVQDVYQMEPSQVATGEFEGMKFGSQMTWSDCFAIGQQSFKQGEHQVAKMWLQTALEKFPTNVESPLVVKAKVEVLEALSDSEYKSGNIKEALRLTDEILQLSPKNKRAIAAQITYREKLKRKKTKAGSKATPKKETKLTDEHLALDVCRGTFEQYSSSPSAGRTCGYITANLPFLLIGPAKLEVVRVDPLVVIYHDVFSDTEVEGLRTLLKDGEKWSLPSRLRHRLEVLSGFGRFGEWTFVSKHYEDEAYSQLNAIQVPVWEENDGVVWIQLNQPRLGGYIAFPQLEMKVNTPRGALLYWATRIEDSVEVDYRTTHHTCPVIAGTLEGIYSVTVSDSDTRVF